MAAIDRVDLTDEIRDWKEAEFGEDVRDANVRAFEKIQTRMNDSIDGVNRAATDVTQNTKAANRAVEKANAAAVNADNVRESTEALRQDLEEKVQSDYWRGKTGETGSQGPQGETGVTAPSAGMFSLYLNPATGDLYADYPTGENPPRFEYNSDTGDLYYVTG